MIRRRAQLGRLRSALAAWPGFEIRIFYLGQSLSERRKRALALTPEGVQAFPTSRVCSWANSYADAGGFASILLFFFADFTTLRVTTTSSTRTRQLTSVKGPTVDATSTAYRKAPFHLTPRAHTTSPTKTRARSRWRRRLFTMHCFLRGDGRRVLCQ